MADQHMTCPQCGGELAVLSDDKRECQSCKKTFTVTTNLVSEEAVAAEETPASVKKGVPVKDRYNQCPRCGGELFLMPDGKRQCQNCKTRYMLMPRSSAIRGSAIAGDDVFDDGMESSGKKKKKKKSAGVIALIIAVVLLIAAVGGFLGYRFLFGDSDTAAGETGYEDVAN